MCQDGEEIQANAVMILPRRLGYSYALSVLSIRFWLGCYDANWEDSTIFSESHVRIINTSCSNCIFVEGVSVQITCRPFGLSQLSDDDCRYWVSRSRACSIYTMVIFKDSSGQKEFMNRSDGTQATIARFNPFTLLYLLNPLLMAPPTELAFLIAAASW